MALDLFKKDPVMEFFKYKYRLNYCITMEQELVLSAFHDLYKAYLIDDVTLGSQGLLAITSLNGLLERYGRSFAYDDLSAESKKLLTGSIAILNEIVKETMEKWSIVDYYGIVFGGEKND